MAVESLMVLGVLLRLRLQSARPPLKHIATSLLALPLAYTMTPPPRRCVVREMTTPRATTMAVSTVRVVTDTAVTSWFWNADG